MTQVRSLMELLKMALAELCMAVSTLICPSWFRDIAYSTPKVVISYQEASMS